MISIRRLHKRFTVSDGAVAAVKSLDLDVADGEFFVIVGASGSGKTTLLRCIAGLEVPDGGEISIAGRIVSSDNPPAWVPPQRRKLGMVFQSYAVWPHLTVFQNVALPLAEGSQRIPRGEVAKRVNEALRLVQLEELADRPATLLSGGQQQRVALARAIAVNSRILLMDEPLSNLDARLREEVRVKIRDLAKQLGSTVLYVTHDQVEAMAISDKVALMRSGELLQVGAPLEIYHKPAHAGVAEFFGSVNWLSGKVIQPGLAESPIGKLRIPASSLAGEEVLLGFRPECLAFAYGHDTGEANVFQATLASSTFLGDQFVFRVRVCDRELIGKNRVVPAHKNGNISVRIDPADVMVFPAGQDIGLSALEQSTRAQ
jgi:iron(III) transport system ATP-binding protein